MLVETRQVGGHPYELGTPTTDAICEHVRRKMICLPLADHLRYVLQWPGLPGDNDDVPIVRQGVESDIC